MLDLSCLCGQVRIRAAKVPEFVNECNCTLCSKSGARWAYYQPAEVTVAGATRGWSRSDKAEASAEVQFCATCGATTHFVLTEGAVARFGNTMMGSTPASPTTATSPGWNSATRTGARGRAKGSSGMFARRW